MAREADARAYWKCVGLGFEFVGVIGVFGYFGYLVDERYGTSPKGILILGGIGLVGGIYWLVKEGFRLMRQFDAQDRSHNNGQEPPL